jgi:hypothetical protein
VKNLFCNEDAGIILAITGLVKSCLTLIGVKSSCEVRQSAATEVAAKGRGGAGADIAANGSSAAVYEDQENNPVIAFSGALLVNRGRPAMNRPGYHAAPRERG